MVGDTDGHRVAFNSHPFVFFGVVQTFGNVAHGFASVTLDKPNAHQPTDGDVSYSSSPKSEVKTLASS